MRDWLVTSSINPDALMGRRHESRTPIPRTVNWSAIAIADYDKRRQVVVLASQAVVNPASKRWTTRQVQARVHLADAASVVDAIGPTGTNHSDVIHAAPDMAGSTPRPTCHWRRIVSRYEAPQAAELLFHPWP